MSYKHLHVEDDQPPVLTGDKLVVGKAVPVQPVHIDVTNLGNTGPVYHERIAAPKPDVNDVAHWRTLAVQAGERLAFAERQAADLRKAADDARARFSKYKGRLDSANQRVNELQAQIITKSVECDTLRAQLAKQDVLAQKVHKFRQSILDGPLWELFAELAVCLPSQKPAGVEAADV